MNNLPQHDCGPTPVAIGKYLWLQMIGFLGRGGRRRAAGLRPAADSRTAADLSRAGRRGGCDHCWACGSCTPRTIQEPLNKQFAIFSNKHNWVMTWLYVMTFGSFIGYANAFPKLIDDVFVTPTNGLVTSNYIWIGAAVGALIRPVGGWLSDKLGGARVTQWDTWIMVAVDDSGRLLRFAGRTERRRPRSTSFRSWSRSSCCLRRPASATDRRFG